MIINPFGAMVHRDIDVDMPIYRIMRLDRFCQMIEYKQLYLRNVLCWDDPWEIPSRLLSMRRNGKVTNGRLFGLVYAANKAIKPLYGSSWAADADNDAMWRIYSSGGKGVCVQTTARKLFQSADFFTIEPEGHSYTAFLGPIRYAKLEKSAEWREFYDEESEAYPDYMIPAFIKREAFSHEKEIRLLIYPQAYLREDGEGQLHPLQFPDVKGINVSLHNLSFIEKVILDPRLDEEKVKTISTCISEHGFLVEQSSLYKLPIKPLENVDFSHGYKSRWPKGAKVWLDSLNDFK